MDAQDEYYCRELFDFGDQVVGTVIDRWVRDPAHKFWPPVSELVGACQDLVELEARKRALPPPSRRFSVVPTAPPRSDAEIMKTWAFNDRMAGELANTGGFGRKLAVILSHVRPVRERDYPELAARYYAQADAEAAAEAHAMATGTA